MQRILICTNWSMSISGIPEIFAKRLEITEDQMTDWIYDCSSTGFRSDELILAKIQSMNMISPTELSYKGSGKYAKFDIIEIPDNVKWHVEDMECACGEQIVENHRTWRSNYIDEE